MEEQMKIVPEVAVVHTDTSVTNAEPPTIEVLTAEIKMYLQIANQSIIEVGKRLIQAKEMLPHGEWQSWLQNNFQLTYRSAKNFMDVAERFGKSEIDFTFKPTQLITMLALPEGDEEKFIDQKAAEGNPVEDMTVKELRAEIKKYKEELEHTKSYLKGSEDANKIMEDRFEYADSERVKYMTLAADAEKRIDGLLVQVADLTEDKDALTTQVNQMKEKLSYKKQVEVPPADYDDIKREVQELRERPIDVATEFPADYAPLKAKVEQLENREKNFKAVYATAQKVAQLFNIANAFSTTSENISASVAYLADENVEQLEESLNALGKLHTEICKSLAVWKRNNAPKVKERVTVTKSEKFTMQQEAWNKLSKMALDKIGFATVIKKLLQEMGGYEKVADVPDDKISELMDQACALYETFVSIPTKGEENVDTSH